MLKVSSDTDRNRLRHHDRGARIFGWKVNFPRVIGLLLLGLILMGSIKAWRIYRLAENLQSDFSQLQSLASQSSRQQQFEQAGLLLPVLRADLEAFDREVRPILWLGPWLEWVPVHGGDLAYTEDGLELAKYLFQSADEALQAVRPLLQAESAGEPVSPAEISGLLNGAQPSLVQAHQSLELAFDARSRIDPERLSPPVRAQLARVVDPLLNVFEDGLSLAIALPELMGVSSDGPKRYLLLVLNEDELRPTGGFITAVGRMVMQDGRVVSLGFENSGSLDDWSKPYPPAPWQLEAYMGSTVLVLRDSNWYADFPRAALYAEYLYSYTYHDTVDGVIAFDQHSLVLLLEAIGPIEVQDASEPIDAGNVIAYMRAAKSRPENAAPGWDYKGFMKKIADSILEVLYSGRGEIWEPFLKAGLRALDERHVSLQFDDPQAAEAIARRGWNGAVSPGNGDFLMVVDSNVGFNKTNALVEASLIYDVDLSEPSSPTSSLVVVHKNNAVAVPPCRHWDKNPAAADQGYPMIDCYWNYLRVYVPSGAELVEASPHTVPGDWMLLGLGVPARVDALEEDISGVQAFGTLLVVPGGRSVQTGFEFKLPDRLLSLDPQSGQWTYALKVQKQPGTRDILLTIRVHLPSHAEIQQTPENAIVQGNNLLLTYTLDTDVEIALVFLAP